MLQKKLILKERQSKEAREKVKEERQSQVEQL
jgi:hypothetical protein